MEFQRKLERTYSSVTDAPQAKLDTLSRLQRNLNPAIPKLTCKAADESGESGYVCVFGVYYPSGDVLEDVTALLSEDAAGWAMDLSWCAPTPEEAEQTLLDWSRQRIALARENFIRTYGRHDRALDEFEALRTATVAVSARACDWSGIPGVYSCTYTLTLTGAWDDTPPLSRPRRRRRGRDKGLAPCRWHLAGRAAALARPAAPGPDASRCKKGHGRCPRRGNRHRSRRL